jgi:16S rRNA (adenine1518-N6/adenine1519-N6)-dimethyltransferase
MVAVPGSADYSSFSVLCSLIWKIHRLGDLKPGSFYPAPKVRSTMLSLEPRNRPLLVTKKQLLTGVRKLFAGRRKTIRNNLKMAVPADAMHDILVKIDEWGIDHRRRPETLAPEEVERIVSLLSDFDTVCKTRRGAI